MPSLNWTKARDRSRMHAARRDDIIAALSRAAIAPKPPPKRPKLVEPVEIAKFWKNRGGEALVTLLKDFHGKPIVDLRVWKVAKDGTLQATYQGVAVSVRKLPELAAAFDKALKKAIELGLLAEEDACE